MECHTCFLMRISSLSTRRPALSSSPAHCLLRWVPLLLDYKTFTPTLCLCLTVAAPDHSVASVFSVVVMTEAKLLCVCVCQQRKQELMKSLLAPIASKFEGLLTSLCRETEEEKQVAYSKCIFNAMALAR